MSHLPGRLSPLASTEGDRHERHGNDGGSAMTPRSQQSANISYAEVWAIDDLFARGVNPSEELDRSLRHGTRVERYQRTWIMGRSGTAEGTFGSIVFGQLGFERDDEPVDLWDSEAHDFRTQRRRHGRVSPFALHLPSGIVAFQLRANVIRPQSFTGALQLLLNEASPMLRWRVHHVTREIPWPRWTAQVERVNTLSIELVRPNPRYRSKDVRRLVEGTNSALTRLVLNAKDRPEGIDINDSLVLEAIDHANDYGEFWAKGTTPDGAESTWRSDKQGGPRTDEVALPAGERDVTFPELAQQVAAVADQAERQAIPVVGAEPDMWRGTRPSDGDDGAESTGENGRSDANDDDDSGNRRRRPGRRRG